MSGRAGWGSVNAEDLYQIATRIAGFDRAELMLEISRRKGRRDGLVNETTVLNAMKVVSDRHKAAEP